MFTVQSGKQHAIAFSAKDHGGDAGDTAPTLRAGTHHKSHANAGVMPAVAMCLNAHAGRIDGESETFIAGTLGAENTRHSAGIKSEADLLIPVQNATRGKDQNGLGVGGDAMFTLDQASQHAVASAMSVRRLLPIECEKLQGFPPGWTDVTYRGKPAADGPRYRALGNSMAVPVIGWVIGRIREVAA